MPYASYHQRFFFLWQEKQGRNKVSIYLFKKSKKLDWFSQSTYLNSKCVPTIGMPKEPFFVRYHSDHLSYVKFRYDGLSTFVNHRSIHVRVSISSRWIWFVMLILRFLAESSKFIFLHRKSYKTLQSLTNCKIFSAITRSLNQWLFVSVTHTKLQFLPVHFWIMQHDHHVKRAYPHGNISRMLDHMALICVQRHIFELLHIESWIPRLISATAIYSISNFYFLQVLITNRKLWH